FTHTYTTVDAHAGGEPLRIVTAGVPRIPGATILEKRRWASEHLDHVRRALMLEPRGHADMYGCFVIEPVSPRADLGVIFMHNEGYSDMCGHGVIALATVAVAQGLVPRSEPETRVGLDTPAGFVEAFVRWDGRRVGSVRFLNVPSFLYLKDLRVSTPSFGELTVDVAFGGAFYAYLDAAQAGLEVVPAQVERLVRLGDEVKRAVTAATPIQHPLEPELNALYGTIVAGPPLDPRHRHRRARGAAGGARPPAAGRGAAQREHRGLGVRRQGGGAHARGRARRRGAAGERPRRHRGLQPVGAGRGR